MSEEELPENGPSEEQGSLTGAGGLRLFRRTWRPQRPTRARLAVVHGFGEHSGRHQPIIRRALARGFEVHALDLRGHGRSAGRRGHIAAWQEFRDDGETFLRSVADAGPHLPLFAFGHSLGGAILLDLGLARGPLLADEIGLAGIVVSAPALDPVGARSRPLEALARIVVRLWPTFSVPLPIDRRALSRSAPTDPAYLADPLLHRRLTVRAAVEIVPALVAIRTDAPRWRLPLLVVHGEADRLAAPDASRAFVEAARAGGAPDVTLLTYPEALHEPHHDREADAVLGDVLDWIEARLP